MATPKKNKPSKSAKPKPEPVHPAIAAFKAQKGLRQCINCPREFKSRSPAHRICGKCRRQLGDIRLPTVYRADVDDPHESEN